MKKQILAFFGYKDYTLAGQTCQYLNRLWAEALEKNRLPLFVPVDCKTLREAVGKVHGDDRWTTIVLGKGKHVVKVVKINYNPNYFRNALVIPSAMSIVGDPGVPRSEIVVVGGIWFNGGIPGNFHLQHMTLRRANQ